MVQLASLGGTAGISLAAQTGPQGRPHYEMVMSANDAVCKPLLSFYRTLLSETFAAIKSHPKSVSSIISDFEVQYPERFQAIGFESPPLVEGHTSNGIYLADVFNNGDPRHAMLVDEMVPRSVNCCNYSTEIRIIKQDVAPARWSWTDPGIFEGAHADLLGWISASDKKYGIIYGYVLSKWPDLVRALKGWPKNRPEECLDFATDHT